MAEKAVFHHSVRNSGGATGVVVTFGSSITSRIRELAVYVAFPANSGAGTLLVESGPHEGYTGTWSTEATLAWAAAGAVKKAAVTGVHGALRLRWSVAVDVGLADIDILGN